ncbi:hypothetical protein [Ferrimonas balearica]|uniref:hypothetical protein n=1 Tax=Ferrimonas balearica TaxID=44012 RepID=UPI001C579546|nr:hypothetical protein [Ferrimonas balearica]MBW3163053.1 hypothetical protein [Ferrimonas balearica]
MLHELINNHIGVNCYVTIGDHYWHDCVYCEMSYEKAEQELLSPDTSKPIDAHVWLTLEDGTVMDFTGEGHRDIIWKRGDFPVEECVSIIDPDVKLDDKKGYHRPFFVGLGYLINTGSIGASRLDTTR